MLQSFIRYAMSADRLLTPVWTVIVLSFDKTMPTEEPMKPRCCVRIGEIMGNDLDDGDTAD